MPNRQPRKLKVYQAHLGFYDTVVAAPNQKAALAAWGAQQNLFAEGQATLASDEAAVAAALQHPETPLLRLFGSQDPFGIKPVLPHTPAVRRPAERKKRAKPEAETRTVPDRSALDAAEAELARVEADRNRETDDFRRRRADLEAEEAAAAQGYEAARSQAQTVLERERRAYGAAGGIVGGRGSSRMTAKKDDRKGAAPKPVGGKGKAARGAAGGAKGQLEPDKARTPERKAQARK